jgi:hypothetical protein
MLSQVNRSLLSSEALIGVHFFGGLFTSDLDFASQGFPPDYLYNNFNDVACGIVTLFEILFLNQWHIQMNIYAWLYGTPAIKLIFVTFYFFGYILGVGIILAFTIDFIVNKLQSTAAAENQAAHMNLRLTGTVSADSSSSPATNSELASAFKLS